MQNSSNGNCSSARSFYRIHLYKSSGLVVKSHFSIESLVVMLCCHGIKQMGKILECPKGTDFQSCVCSKKLKCCWVSLPEKRDSMLLPLKSMGGLPLISVGAGACLSFSIRLFKLLKLRCLLCQWVQGGNLHMMANQQNPGFVWISCWPHRA